METQSTPVFISKEASPDTNPYLGSSMSGRPVDQLFQRVMLDHLREGVIFVDGQLKVVLWNNAAEQITGIRCAAMLAKQWTPSRVSLKDRFGAPIDDMLCPIADVIRRGESKLIAASVTGKGGRQIAIDMHVVPIIGHEGVVHGASIFLRDLSSQVDLEQQVLTLYAHATRDQLTGVANRAHFERAMEARLREFTVRGTICSLIVSDIDNFKRINDDLGHHIGDQALMNFAKLIQQNTRVEDLVARFGGEEFVILCPECELQAAVIRAEEIRKALESTPLAVLNGRSLTASFGVSEVRRGDTLLSIFVRADQALLKAKESGRNRVEFADDADRLDQIAQVVSEPKPVTPAVRPAWNWRDFKEPPICSDECSTASPCDVIVQKLKGFVLDMKARILRAEPEYVEIRIDKIPGLELRRLTDRHIPLLVSVELREAPAESGATSHSRTIPRTTMRISIRPYRLRDRRHRELTIRAERLSGEIKSYLMIER